MPSAPHRAVVEHLVRQAVYSRLGKPLPRAAAAPSPLVVNVSARHCHLTQEAVDALFGKGHQLQVHKWLYQEGHFAAKETVTLVAIASTIPDSAKTWPKFSRVTFAQRSRGLQNPEKARMHSEIVGRPTVTIV